MKKTLFNTNEMKFALCYKNAMGRMTALACTCTIQLATSMAHAMANDLDLGQYYSPKQRPIIYIYDQEGHNYGSF